MNLINFICSRKMRCCRCTFTKRKNWSICKYHFIFFSVSNENSCKVEVTGKRVKEKEDKEGLQISCKLQFTGDGKYIGKLKKIYRQCYEYIFFILFFITFFDHKLTKVWLNEHIFALGTKKVVQISKRSNYQGSNEVAQNIDLLK